MMATEPHQAEQSPPTAARGLEEQQQVQVEQQQRQQQQEKKKRFIINKVNGDVSYYYVNYSYPGLVWRNAIIFAILHLLYVCGFYQMVTQTSWPSWLFSK